MSKLELLKELENMIALQSNCLDKGKWDDFDKIKDKIKELEVAILKDAVE